MKVVTNPPKVDEVVNSRFIEKIYPSRAVFRETLLAGKRLTIYHGVDPTSPDLHLGHSTNYLFLKMLQDLGHRIVLLIGDFTARVGDPSGRLSARKSLTEKEILKNSKYYKEQAGKVLDFKSKTNPAEVAFNSKWLEELRFGEILRLMSHFTLAQVIERDMFQERIKKNKPIYLHEFIYPLLQGYDSVGLDTDAEVGGTDQTFNMLMGREIVKLYEGKEKFVITTPLLVSADSDKKLMSKSEGGYVGLNDFPGDMFGKVMAIPDTYVIPCFTLCTRVPDTEIKKIKALVKKSEGRRDAKAQLAYEIVKLYHGESAAEKAGREFNKVFQRKEQPSKIRTVKLEKLDTDIVGVLVKSGLASSKSGAHRLIKQGGVKINNRKILEPKTLVNDGDVVKAGKRHFIRIAI